MKKFFQRLKDVEYNNLYPLFFTLIFVFILIQYSFNSLDALFYDLWVKYDFVTEKNQEIVIVTMDEESDQFLGEIFPYTYATHVRFLNKLLDDKPSIVNYLIQLASPETDLELKYSKRYKKLLDEFVLNGGFFRFGTNKDAWGEQLPPEELSSLGYSLALINKDGNTFAKDNVARRVILNVSGEDSLHLWSANKYRELKGLERIEALDYKGSYYNREADASFTLFKYSDDPYVFDQVRTIPFHRVVVGNFPRGFFKNKLVLIGSQYIANGDDFVATPFGKDNRKAPKVNVHAQSIEALIGDNTVLDIPEWVTDTISLLLALILSFVISRIQPAKGLLLTMSIIIAFFLMAYSSFVFLGIWFKLSHIVLSIFVVYYIWVPFRAIGEYQTRYAIQEETKILKKVDRLKQNFISLMSHDLKTPVAKIAGMADILQVQYENTSKQKELLNNIVNSTKELNDFITSILDLTKIESRNITMNLETKDITPIVEKVVEKLRFDANAKKMIINTEFSPLYPITIDVVLVERVVSNLIGNAIKYAGDGAKISIKSWDDDKWVYLEITDTGKGINPDEIEYIFDKFYRVKNDDSHKIKGSGLGLYLVKYFIELHEGEISVSSELGKGTSFVVKLKNA